LTNWRAWTAFAAALAQAQMTDIENDIRGALLDGLLIILVTGAA
jgi:hypothetical protein